MTDQLISICIPVYNGEKFLKQCIESCLAQTYRHYEVVVCDDCSTDNSGQIVQAYMETNTKIKFFRNEKNFGLVGNWNNAIKYAGGHWIKMLFQDDYMAPDCLEQFINAADKGATLLVSRRNFIFDYPPQPGEQKNFDEKSRRFDDWAGGNVTTISPRLIAATAAKNIAINIIGEPSLTMFTKTAAIKAGLFDKDFIQICDLDFLLRMSAEKGLVYLPSDLCFFRLHAHTTTNVNLSTRMFELRYLEPLLMAARLLTHPAYAPLTQQLTLAEKFRIRLYLKTRLLEAGLAARKTGKNDLLEQYLKLHPSILSAGNPNFMHRIVYAVLHLKRSLNRIRK